MLALKVENISYSTTDQLLLKDINFTCNTLGVHAVLGPNGAGKSLLLSLLHGLIKPDQGRITWDGIPPEKNKPNRGYVFQSPVVLRRSVWENLHYPLKIRRQASHTNKTHINQMLERAHLVTLADHPAASLSGGEMQRMCMARALITNPKILLLDEPCSNLDPASTKLIEMMIRDFVVNGGTVFIATHDLAQAKRLAETVLLLQDGSLLEYETAQCFFETPKTDEAKAYLNGAL